MSKDYHISEDNCLECNFIDIENKKGRYYFCKKLKIYIRTNPLCFDGWEIIKKRRMMINVIYN